MSRSTTRRLWASISSIFSGCLPPASAKSGRPPPPPPTIGAISFTICPALHAARQIRRDGDDDLHLAVACRREHDDAALDRRLQRIGQRRGARPCRGRRPSAAPSFTPRPRRSSSRPRRVAPPPIASFVFTCVSSRARRLASACSRSIASTACSGLHLERVDDAAVGRRAAPAPTAPRPRRSAPRCGARRPRRRPRRR